MDTYSHTWCLQMLEKGGGNYLSRQMVLVGDPMWQSFNLVSMRNQENPGFDKIFIVFHIAVWQRIVQ